MDRGFKTRRDSYMPNSRPPRCMREQPIEPEGQRDSSTTTVGDFTTMLSVMDRMTRCKVSEELEDWDNCINQLDLTDITQNTLLECMWDPVQHKPYGRPAIISRSQNVESP